MEMGAAEARAMTEIILNVCIRIHKKTKMDIGHTAGKDNSGEYLDLHNV